VGRPQPATWTFDDFFRTRYVGMVRLLFGLTGDVSEAEDLAQEAMARVFERWDRVKVMASPDGYAYTVAVNAYRRRRRRRLPLLFEHFPKSETDEVEARVDLMTGLGRLPRRQREALVLTICFGMTSDEAAEVMRVRPASVRAQVHRGKATLKELLGGSNAE
jgi:RNA polymerase sigma factor (sigma-70 family)